MILLDCEDYRGPQVVQEIKEFPEVTECFHITGDNDIVIRASFTSVSHLETLVRRLAQHGEVTTSLILSNYLPRRSIR
jgi:Lrp/AsnC family leucine-responsive transcriptional regulator